jgi:ribonuclease P protein component
VGSLEMLRSAVDFQKIQGQSRSRAHPVLMVRYRRNELGRTRFGISTSRRVGGAVVRNTIRRRLREILRRMGPSIEPGWDILIVARQPAVEASQEQLQEILTKLTSSAGLSVNDTIGNH